MKEADILDAVADLLECFGVNEGTWCQRQWRPFGISEEAERVFTEAWKNKYGQKERQSDG